jgi:hypothetical protein
MPISNGKTHHMIQGRYPRNGAGNLKGNKGWSAEDLALIAAAITILGDLLTFLSLLKERQEKK